MNAVIVLVVLIGYTHAQLDSPLTLAMLSRGMRGGASTTGSVNPLGLAVLGGSGNSKMLQMMTLMNMMNKEPTPTDASANAIAQPKATRETTMVNPMMDTLMTLSLCRETVGDQRFCTPFTCKLESIRRYTSPNLLQCQQMMGCCFKDVRSMYFANTMKGL
ncbi:uncharacterized protein LOC125680863 [Ostrea edulis]|uniref:uncharacterized protein LOC125680863 n=1 Tax=Ostrea edulis TaxID=37623 RepID=UPI0020941AA8|nr:uncharacterized protein LOC125680863 [Ostrea edulis]